MFGVVCNGTVGFEAGVQGVSDCFLASGFSPVDLRLFFEVVF